MSRHLVPLIVVIAILLLPSVVYVGGYFLLDHDQDRSDEFRFYPHGWMVTAFEPMADLETYLTGEVVVLLHVQRASDGSLEIVD